jgi:peroxiredoxin
MPEPNVGDQAPDFSLPSTIDNEWSLSSVRGQKGVIVSFHRYDFTGDSDRGCFCQISTWRQEYSRIQAADGEVVEVSADSIHSHRRFAQELGGVPFPLLADFTKRMTESFGMLNEQDGAPKRAVFVIDKNGVIRYKNTNFNASEPGQYEEAIKALEAAR